MKKRALAAGVLAACMLVSAAGCGGGASAGGQTAGGSSSGGQTAAAGGNSQNAGADSGNGGGSEAQAAAGTVKDTVTVACAAEPDCFFPFHSSLNTNMDEVPILHNVYESLIKLGPDNSHEPLLATSWEISDDGCTYTLHLRDDVYFHNGDKMTAEDVEFTLDNTGHTSAGMAQLANYDDTEIIDENTVAIHLTDPYGPFLNALCGRFALIVNKSLYEEIGEDAYNEAPVGTGPYKFVSRVSGDRITLEANEDYWGGAPAIKNVIFAVLSDTNTQMISLENGDIDVLINGNIGALSKLQSDKVTWATQNASSIDNLKFNCNKGPAADINFRKAVQCGINKEDVNIGVYEGMATIGDIQIAPGFSGRPDDGTFKVVEYDPEKAKEYLAASNYNGEEFKIVTIAGTKDESAAQIIQGQLIELGINCTVNAVDSSSYSATVEQSGDFGASLRFGGVSVLDADGLFYQYHSKSLLVNGKYDAGVCSDELDGKLQEARVEVDPEKRKLIYAEACDIITDNAYGACIYYDVNACAYNKALTGVVPRSLTGLYFFNDWSWQ